MIIDLGMPIDEVHTCRLQQLVGRLKDEHRTLKKELDHVQEQTSLMVDMQGSEESKNLLQGIRRQLEVLLHHLESHERWEEEEVLPILAGYASQGVEPTFLTSTWVLEEDLKQAERFVRSFLEHADHCETSNSQKLKTAISLLSVACSVLAEHLLAEEELIFPVADQLLSSFHTIDN